MLKRDADAPAVALKQQHWLDSGSAHRIYFFFNYAHVHSRLKHSNVDGNFVRV